MIGLIVVDTISMLYRLELGTQEEVYEVNKSLGRQIGILSEIARKHYIPVLITNQVYADFDNPGNVNMVGGDLLKYGSKCLIELKRARSGIRCALLKKHRSLPEGKEVTFRIVNSGLELIDHKERAQQEEIKTKNENKSYDTTSPVLNTLERKEKEGFVSSDKCPSRSDDSQTRDSKDTPTLFSRPT